MERTQQSQIGNLREQIARDISRAIDSTIHYSGKEYDLNRHNWVQITTDRIVAAVMYSLPEPVDIPTKYEIKPGTQLPVTLVDPEKDDSWNQRQLDILTHYSEDSGYNRYYFEYTDYLKALYTIPQPVIQSENEEHRNETRTGKVYGSEGGSQQEGSNESDNSEPSKVR